MDAPLELVHRVEDGVAGDVHRPGHPLDVYRAFLIHRVSFSSSFIVRSEARRRGAQAIADPEGKGEAREHETEPRHYPARDQHGDVTEQGPHALLHLEPEERELLIEQPGGFAEELLDQAEDAPTRVGRLGARIA